MNAVWPPLAPRGNWFDHQDATALLGMGYAHHGECLAFALMAYQYALELMTMEAVL